MWFLIFLCQIVCQIEYCLRALYPTTFSLRLQLCLTAAVWARDKLLPVDCPKINATVHGAEFCMLLVCAVLCCRPLKKGILHPPPKCCKTVVSLDYYIRSIIMSLEKHLCFCSQESQSLDSGKRSILEDLSLGCQSLAWIFN